MKIGLWTDSHYSTALLTCGKRYNSASLEKIRKAIPERVLFLVDGAQGAGHYPLHLKTLGADFLAVAGHKGLHGIQGSGALLFSERIVPTPLLYGGTRCES